jgi:hypothetical protein
MLIKGRKPVFQQAEDVSSGCTKETGKAQEPSWEPCSSTGKNLGLNSGPPQEAEGESDQLSKGTQVTPFLGVKPCISGSGSRMEVL